MLQNMLNEFSSDLGLQYLVATRSDMDGRLVIKDRISSTLNTRNDGTDDQLKTFAIKPKDDRLLLRIWLEFVLPSLPQILVSGIGNTYAASLVHYGRSELDKQPCIQIECPHIPDEAGRKTIGNTLTKIFEANSFDQPIKVRFFKGRPRKLSGEIDIPDEVASSSAIEEQNMRYNLNRPFSKLRMGASLGLLCSETLSGTLGGFVSLNCQTYFLTSDHLVPNPSNSVSKKEMDADHDAITSPSMSDLLLMEEHFKQKLRDSRGEVNRLMEAEYGDRDISDICLSNLAYLPILLREAIERQKRIESLLTQVGRPRHEYKIGSAFKHSIEPRRAPYPPALADTLGLKNKFFIHFMDWCLCKMSNETAENRHKYQSIEDAKKDPYTEEADFVDPPGEVCYDICDVEPGVAVYYVGQGSGRREGRVNSAPISMCCGGEATHDWSIIGSETPLLVYENVEGDSGAWVFRQRDDKLMGQVHGLGTGQVLFTPIKVIFDDVEALYGFDISLPPPPSNLAPVPVQAYSTPLCAIRDEDSLNPYNLVAALPPSLKKLRSPIAKHQLQETAKDEVGLSLRSHGDTSSSPPDLTEFPLSPSTKSANPTDEKDSAEKVLQVRLDSVNRKPGVSVAWPGLWKVLSTPTDSERYPLYVQINYSGWPPYFKNESMKATKSIESLKWRFRRYLANDHIDARPWSKLGRAVGMYTLQILLFI